MFTLPLTGMRAIAEASMRDTCAVVRDTSTADTGGGITTTADTVAVTRCGLSAVSSSAERAVADRMGWTVAYSIRLPFGTDVTPSDRLVVDGRTYEIGGILTNDRTATAKIAVCQEVSP
jgi:SPP1 family predicted phage head-tail adaptor